MLGQLWFDNGALMVSIGDGELFEGVNWGERGILPAGSVPLSWAGPLDAGFLGGKILKLNPDTGCGYADNPFANGNLCSAQSKVYAMGLRNPYRCTNSPSSGSHVCGDVGWYSYESIKLINKGGNLGWPCYEGMAQSPWPATESSACQAVFQNRYIATVPVPAWNPAVIVRSINHNGQSSAIIGGVFAPARFTGIGGFYLYGDFAQNTISGFAWPSGLPLTIATGADSPVAFKVSPYDGNIYYLGQCPQCSNLGILRRISPKLPTPPPAPPIIVKSTVKTIKATTTVAGGGLISLVPDPTIVVKPTSAACVVAKLGIGNLKAGWNSFMFLSTFPGLRFIKNGLGWGPIEVDASVGSPARMDGKPLTIDNVRFTNGLGTKAVANISIPLDGVCYRFSAWIGVDDEVGIGAAGAYGEWVIKGLVPATTSKPAHTVMLYNSTQIRKKYLVSGDAPWKVDVYNLHFYSRIYLETLVPAGLPNNPNTHLDW
jgi:hypothetical protein